MATPPGQLTRGTILDRALTITGNTKIKNIGRTALNTILFDLNTQFEWPHLLTSATPTINQSTFTLPTGFLKSEDDRALTILTVDGIASKQVVWERDRQTYEAQATPIDSLGVPRIWCVDRNADVGRVWPTPTTVTLTVSLRYKALPADVDETDTTTYDADTPSFPWHNYLIQAVIVWALQYENDPRRAQEMMVAEKLLSRIREASMPLHSQISRLPLDPTVFTQPFEYD